MKIKASQAAFATLTLVMEMAAKQRVFHNVLLKSISDTDLKYNELLEQINEEAKVESDLIRAVVLQFSEIDETDLLNGFFDI
ncbi:hypothetical protein HDF19_10080 [Mucilaginibacter sp. E4BP6]|jgi:formate-dependent nitrite reductase cytochrome c552 subunit|uniref:hypothetical protein n=1 Tax=Mucilaginibacter sp. E4BP6 TaxID=2723089 RepID=UPI0015C7856A|nr:hypothetical protein [Mucilaginibacter sp. E4BP6]NYE67824.1 formate-dependent nitrite reductase cytochrome c552 subunit [Mucilaginibacter sp. E4BP6]